MMAKDYYKILGLDPAATAAEVSKAFKQAARRHHPDLNPGHRDSEDLFKEINEAYEVLSDPFKRREYDRLHGHFPNSSHTSPPQEPSPPYEKKRSYGFHDLGEVFADVFGADARVQSEPISLPGNTLLVRLSLAFEEAALGCEKLIKVGDARRVKAKIPGGVEQGSYIRLAGMGEKGIRGARDGDLLIEIDVAAHARFERTGEIIRTRAAVPLCTAIFGGKVEVATLDGPVALAIPAGTQGNAEFRLRGKGAVNFKTKKRGDELVYVDMYYPTNLSARDRNELRRILG